MVQGVRVVGLMRDLRQAGRMARRHRAFSAFVVAAMALGIGLNSAVFSLVDALLLRPLPVVAPGRLVHVYSSAPRDLLGHAPMSFPDYEALRDRARSFAGLAAYAWYPLAIERGGGSELVLGEAATGSYFETLGVTAALGRALTDADDHPAGSAVVLSQEAWRRRFASDPEVVGREVRLNGRPFRVVGVAPAAFRGLVPGLAPDLWLPIHAAVALPTGVTIVFGGVTPGVARTADRVQRWVWVTGRLRPRASLDGAAAEVRALAAQLAGEYPATNAQRTFAVLPAHGVRFLPELDRAVRGGSALVTGLFALGLLLASANIASLFLARALVRRREIATRLALGAGRWPLVRQLFVEGLVLALAGGCLGLLVAGASNAALARVDLPASAGVNWPLDLVLAPSVSVRVLCFALAGTGLTAVVFALAPALEAVRADLAAMLREAGAGTVAGSPPRLRAALVAVQFAGSVVLLGAAGVALGTLIRSTRVDVGFTTEGAATVTLSPDLLGYEPEETEAFFTRIRHRVAELPGVRSVALASHVPLTAALNFGAAAPEAGTPDVPETLVDFAAVDPRYFEAMGIPLVAGRAFSERDGPEGPRVVIVNEALARRFWPGRAAVGRRLSDGAEVIGVARDGKYRTVGERARPFLYRSLAQDPRGTLTLVVRAAGDPRPLLPALRRAVRGVDPRVPMSGPRTLAQTLADALFVPRMAAGLFASFAVLALLLAAVGVLGVVSHLVSARRREIGLRVALGASRRCVLLWLLRHSLAPVAGGLAAGVVAAAGTTWMMSARLAGIPPVKAPILMGTVLLLALVALAACIVPAWRAARLDPAAALRHE